MSNKCQNLWKLKTRGKCKSCSFLQKGNVTRHIKSNTDINNVGIAFFIVLCVPYHNENFLIWDQESSGKHFKVKAPQLMITVIIWKHASQLIWFVFQVLQKKHWYDVSCQRNLTNCVKMMISFQECTVRCCGKQKAPRGIQKKLMI